jgi:copper(I)-binding protein
MKRIVIVLLALSLFLSACGSRELEIHDPWARSALQGENGVIYLIVHNHTAKDDVLLSASSDIAQAVEIHETSMTDDGVMQMAPVSSIPLAAGEEIEFQPGGLHIMLVGLNRDLKTGETITLTLHFEKHADIIVQVPVMDMSDMDGSHDMN